MRSAYEDTWRKALKYGANGATVKAYKPARLQGDDIAKNDRDQKSTR